MTFNANNPTASGMVLTFDDEFNSASISNASGANGTKWTDHIWFHGSTPQDFQVSNGVAHILGNDPNDPWAANMETADSNGQGFSQKFGYFEADMKVTGGQGTWPAFWMYDVNKTTDPNAINQEFDIMEGQGSVHNGYFGTIHRDTGGNDQQNPDNFINTGQDIANGFHRFGLLWDPNSPDMTFYFDGQPVKTVPKFDTTDQNPMQLIVGSGFGDIGLGSNGVNGNTPIPADVQVDYVRAYQFGDQNPHAVQAEAVSPGAGGATPAPSVAGTPPQDLFVFSQLPQIAAHNVGLDLAHEMLGPLLNIGAPSPAPEVAMAPPAAVPTASMPVIGHSALPDPSGLAAVLLDHLPTLLH